jgi:hypothetical protein
MKAESNANLKDDDILKKHNFLDEKEEKVTYKMTFFYSEIKEGSKYTIFNYIDKTTIERIQ